MEVVVPVVLEALVGSEGIERVLLFLAARLLLQETEDC